MILTKGSCSAKASQFVIFLRLKFAPYKLVSCQILLHGDFAGPFGEKCCRKVSEKSLLAVMLLQKTSDSIAKKFQFLKKKREEIIFSWLILGQ